MNAKEIKTKYFAALMAVMFFLCGAPSQAQDDTGIVEETEEQVTYDNMFNNLEETEETDIVALAKTEENLSTFVQLLEQSGLDTSIEFAGPVTLLAPTNEAFENLPKDKYDKLTDPENTAMLADIIRAHILPNKVLMREFDEDKMIETSTGEEIPVNTTPSLSGTDKPVTVVIGGATIVKPDVEATNGVIHVINEVIIPEETEDVTFDGHAD